MKELINNETCKKYDARTVMMFQQTNYDEIHKFN